MSDRFSSQIRSPPQLSFLEGLRGENGQLQGILEAGTCLKHVRNHV